MSERMGYMDHISLAVPDVVAQVDFLANVMGMTAAIRSDEFGLVVDPDSKFRIEITRAEGDRTKLLHVGFQVRNVDEAFATLTQAGMDTVHAPHRRERAHIRTAFVKDAAGLEIQVSTAE
jgi:catechol 2,3-dioxygenase-like lactoylglutathione lyase family enzyme